MIALAVAVAAAVVVAVVAAAGYSPPAGVDTTAVVPKVPRPSHAADAHPSDPAHQVDLDLEPETKVDLASEPEPEPEPVAAEHVA